VHRNGGVAARPDLDSSTIPGGFWLAGTLLYVWEDDETRTSAKEREAMSAADLRVLNPAELAPARAVRLHEELAYQAGAVVSRTLAKTRGGSVTLFAFDAGQELSEHTAPFDAFVQVLDGEVELVIGGASVPARTGETVLMPKGVPHAVKATTAFKMLLTLVREPK
jgi:quercetin dioxygenase-like cupin family protein